MTRRGLYCRRAAPPGGENRELPHRYIKITTTQLPLHTPHTIVPLKMLLFHTFPDEKTLNRVHSSVLSTAAVQVLRPLT